jgi:hypothetical protein
LVLIENRLSLTELPRLLTDKPYREHLLQHVSDANLVHFFHERFDRWGRETPLMIESLLNKSTALTLNPYLMPMLGASSCLSLQHIMDQGQVLLVNLRTPDEESRNLLGSLLMTAFEQAALAREALPKSQRRRFFLIVDEFQKFTATEGSVTTLAEILSECRKYGLHLIFAHQSWGQLQSSTRLTGALEQAQVKAIFGTGRQTAAAIAKELFMADPQAVKHEVIDETAKERTHPIFDPVMEQFEVFTQAIQRLRRRHVLVKLPEAEKVLEVRTPTIPPSRLSREHLTQIKRLLAKQIGYSRQEIEQQIARRGQKPPVVAPTSSDRGDDGSWQETLWQQTTQAEDKPKCTVFQHSQPQGTWG